MLNLSWTTFFACVLGSYLLINVVFTGLYLLGGPYALAGLVDGGLLSRFGEIFSYSIQVLTTLGSGALQPATIFTKVVFALEALTGTLGFAVGAALIFARISNPAVKILFSRRAVIAPYDGGTAFMFRIVNGRSNEFINVSATVTLAMTKKDGKRSFHQLTLERNSVLLFPLSWTVVHPITKESPLYGMMAKEFAAAQAEFLVAITATDQDLSKDVYVRHSYLFSEIVVGAKFVNVIERTPDGTVVVDPARIHEIEKAELPQIAAR